MNATVLQGNTEHLLSSIYNCHTYKLEDTITNSFIYQKLGNMLAPHLEIKKVILICKSKMIFLKKIKHRIRHNEFVDSHLSNLKN